VTEAPHASFDALVAVGAARTLLHGLWPLAGGVRSLIDVDGDRACDLSVDRLFLDSRATAAEVLYVSPERNAGRNNLTEFDADLGEYYCDDWFNREWPRE
jgi:hypothetical protein